MSKAWTSWITNQYFYLKRSENVQKCMFLKTPKFGMQQKARIFFSVLPNLNVFHILTQDTESNHLMQKTKN